VIRRLQKAPIVSGSLEIVRLLVNYRNIVRMTLLPVSTYVMIRVSGKQRLGLSLTSFNTTFPAIAMR
jgi:hypothetical protein